ncbi:cyclic AMP-dependent transcription factor ATF-6 beta isoform X1 [Mauremys mutica]|uniref:cyclic AMP-dependent transcription factor ATF-6 beta isoform X1 n=1 Tax=Mauremys mutica TaxID=74926 RepID=UPI001D16AC5A|nr:cyclic AMP-dependent transcription factor ATF-6 beta isoform X1 [Mauremys mutica]
MAALAPELLVLHDSGRFLADNLLSSEDWDAALYSCLDDGEEPAALFPCLEPSALFDDGFDLGMDTSPPEPPWDQMPTSLFPGEPCLPPAFGTDDLQVKSEPVSPASSHSSDSSILSMTPDSPRQAASPDDVMGVKAEDPPTPPCMFGDVLAPPVGTVQISLLPAPETQTTPGKPVTPIKAESILSRKPPIQPKPVVVATVSVQPAATPSPTILLQTVPGAQPQPLKPAITVPAPSVVISQSDLLHLPLSGLLKVQPPGKEGPPARLPPSAPKPEAKTIVPAPSQLGPCNPEIDVKVLKRQQRMIKNRESACQSRRKKKEYLQGLECRLREALADNERLRRENALLRRRLDCVLGESRELKFSPGNRKVVCVMVVLLFIAFNFGPVSISEQKAVETVPPSQGAGAGQSRRHLLGVVEQLPKEAPGELREELAPASVGKTRFRNLTAALSGMKDLMLRDLDKLFLASDCRHFNRTESLRLADELSGWVRRHQINRRKPLQARKPRANQSQESLQREAPSPSRYVPASPPERPERDSLSELQVYQRPDRTEHHFMDAIDRREDTFYVVSFRRDHLLLPAISHNKTTRPKMSLVMPAMALNESLYNASRGFEVMMQIDCEVMDTRVIHIKSSTVPPSLRRPPAPDNRTQAPSVPPRPARGPLRSARRPRTFYLGEQGEG